MSSSRGNKLNFGSELRRLRLISHQTQECLAADADVDPATVSQWENSIILPKKKNLDHLLKALKCTDEEKLVLRRLWHEAKAEKRAELARYALQELISKLEQLIGESRRNPRDKEFMLVKRDDWMNLVRHIRQFKQRYSDE